MPVEHVDCDSALGYQLPQGRVNAVCSTEGDSAFRNRRRRRIFITFHAGSAGKRGDRRLHQWSDPPSGNICELRLTTVGASTFTPSAEMGQLEALLVGGGGHGGTSTGYGAGGGGEVKVVGFGSDTTTLMVLTVGDAGVSSSAAQGAVTATARAGASGDTGVAGKSGTPERPVPPGGKAAAVRARARSMGLAVARA